VRPHELATSRPAPVDEAPGDIALDGDPVVISAKAPRPFGR